MDNEPLNNKKYLLHINKKTLISTKENFDIISSDILDVFKTFLDKSTIIKVGGLFSKNKLLMPFNYNDKNVDYIYINMLFIKNKKNDFGELLFEFPKLKLNIIEKIRKDISNKNVLDYIKDINNGIKEKELSFSDKDGIKYKYKATYYSDLNNLNQNNLASNKNINIKESINDKKDINISKIKLESNKKLKELNNIFDFDINNLTAEELEQKIQEIEEETLNQIEIENNLKEKEFLLLKENNNKSINKENINFEEEYKKYEEKLKETELKIENTLNEIKYYHEKEKNLSDEYKKVKTDLDNKENLINLKLKNLEKREIALNNEENELNKKEEKLYKEKNDIINKKEEMKIKQEEINKKLKIIKKEEDTENERMNNELEEELKQLENELDENNNNMGIVDENEEEKENNSLENISKNKNIENNSTKKKFSSYNENLQYKKMKSLQEKKPFMMINKSINDSNFERKTSNASSSNDASSKDFYSRRISLPNFTLKNKLNFQENFEITENNKSIGLKKMKPVNLNSIIQCFVHLKDVSQGILNLEKNNFFKNPKGFELSEGYLKVIKNLFFSDKLADSNNKDPGAYELNDFWKIIQNKDKKNILMKNKQYINSKDLLNFLIEELHKELNTKKILSTKQLTSDININFEGLNEKEALYKYLEEFTKNNNSLISKNFYGLLKNKIICQTCKTEKYNFKFYSFLNFNLSEIKNFISSTKNSNSKEKNIIKLYDCFDCYSKPEYLVGESGLYCNKCKSKNTTTILRSIYSSHPILPIIIDRGDDSNINQDKIDFPEVLDISKYIDYKTNSKLFYLCGVVSNFGLSNNFGKFEAFCRMEHKGKWYNFNDEHVSESNWEDVHNNGMQYILFYHKI